MINGGTIRITAGREQSAPRSGSAGRLMKKIGVLLSAAVMAASVLIGAAPVTASAAAATGIKAGTVATNKSPLNVRSGASSTASVRTTLKKGSYVTIVSVSGSWTYVKYGASSYGYCSSTYIKEVSGSYEAYIATNSGKLNIRSAASSTSSVLTTLAKDTAVVVIGESGDFYRILYNGVKTGYAAKRYIKAAQQQSGTYAAVSLNVVRYKQTDSRWSSVKIGSSGKTIGNIGCALTSLAMTESYRTGTSVTPPVMATKLKFTSGGALYWPSDYVSYNSSDVLAEIYKVLRSGRPVIYGGRSSGGSSHWVVVTGFRGGELTASNFTINDPGTASRTLLSQYLTSYPNFITIRYYK